jgi:hypothetical protein
MNNHLRDALVVGIPVVIIFGSFTWCIWHAWKLDRKYRAPSAGHAGKNAQDAARTVTRIFMR